MFVLGNIYQQIFEAIETEVEKEPLPFVGYPVCGRVVDSCYAVYVGG